MLITHAAPLRSALSAVKLHSSMITPCTTCSALAPLQQLSPLRQSRHHSSTTSTLRVRKHLRASLGHYTIRHASLAASSPPTAPYAKSSPTKPKTPVLEPTSTSSPAKSAESTPSGTIPTTSPHPNPTTSYAASVTPPSSSSTQQPLTWNAFLRLRRIRRRYNLVASIACGSATLFGGAGVMVEASQNLEFFNQFGIDPFIVMGFLTLGCGALGWLSGPVLGSAVFGIRYRGLRGEMALKEKDLFQRIKKRRVDPSNSSSSNPVPDYYGEKIGSVAQYRTWLRDQRAYNKRKLKSFV